MLRMSSTFRCPRAQRRSLRSCRRADGPLCFRQSTGIPWAYWFESASEEHARWRWPAMLIGKERTRQLYVGWQRRKAPKDDSWKTQRRLLQQATRVLPNSKTEADHLCTTFSLDNGFGKKVDFIPNGVDETLYEGTPSPSTSFVEKYQVRDFVLQIGTISPVKNQLGLINALFDISVPIVFIGHTPQCKDRVRASMPGSGGGAGECRVRRPSGVRRASRNLCSCSGSRTAQLA